MRVALSASDIGDLLVGQIGANSGGGIAVDGRRFQGLCGPQNATLRTGLQLINRVQRRSLRALVQQQRYRDSGCEVSSLHLAVVRCVGDLREGRGRAAKSPCDLMDLPLPDPGSDDGRVSGQRLRR